MHLEDMKKDEKCKSDMYNETFKLQTTFNMYETIVKEFY